MQLPLTCALASLIESRSTTLNSRIPLSDSGVLVLLFSVVVAAEAHGVTLKFEKVLRFS